MTDFATTPDDYAQLCQALYGLRFARKHGSAGLGVLLPALAASWRVSERRALYVIERLADALMVPLHPSTESDP